MNIADGSNQSSGVRQDWERVACTCVVVGLILPTLFSTAVAEVQEHSTDTNPPWGRLERLRITIERPRRFIDPSGLAEVPDHWFFGGTHSNDLHALFQRAAISETDFNPARWQVTRDGIRVPVNAELLLSLSPEARQTLYPLLGQFPENFTQDAAFHFRKEIEAEVFHGARISQQTMNMVRSRFYERADTLWFADMGAVLTRVDTATERVELIKLLSRESALLVKLRVDENSDIKQLVNYWGRRGRAKDLEPLLESLQRTPGGATIDLAHLLPPFARMRLYSYPWPLEDGKETRQDCFWSSFNFFREQPEDRYGDAALVKAAFAKEFYIVKDAPTFGDILLVVNDQGMAVHAAVYLAEDIFFTKNGAAYAKPWVLMDRADMLACYTNNRPPRTILYRLRDAD